MKLNWYNPSHWGTIKSRKKKRIEYANQLADWKKDGNPSPPPHIVKQGTINKYLDLYKPKVLVETGTFMGDMIEAMLDKFEKIYSIELSSDFVNRARKKFKFDPHVEILEGDSTQALPIILNKLDTKALFWLDGHYSGHDTALGSKQTPIEEELISVSQHIAKTGHNHVILIDDARLFIGKDDYPTMEYMKSLISRLFSDYSFTVENDSIILVKK